MRISAGSRSPAGWIRTADNIYGNGMEIKMGIDIRAVTGFLRKNMMIIAACLLPLGISACGSDGASSRTSQEIAAGADDTAAVTEADTGTEDNSADETADAGTNGVSGKSEEQEQQAEADKELDKEPEASGSTEVTGKEAEVKDDWSSAVESSVYVKKVTGLPGDFFTGADMSSYLAEKESGVKYYDFDGNELDDAGFFRFLYENGTNLLRVRVWVDPYDKDGHGYGGGNCDLEHAVKLGKLATDAGMRVLIDFHYSDFWADPGKQRAPKAWENDDLETKCTHLHDYTKESLETLLSEGVDVAMVQVGNETNNGIAGEDDWNDMPKLFAEGVRAIREVSAESGHEIMAAVHFANPEHPGNYRTFAKALEEGGVDYDVFCTSYYPYWHGTLKNLSGILKDISSKYGKKVMVSETSYVYTFEDGDGAGNGVAHKSGHVVINGGGNDRLVAAGYDGAGGVDGGVGPVIDNADGVGVVAAPVVGIVAAAAGGVYHERAAGAGAQIDGAPVHFRDRGRVLLLRVDRYAPGDGGAVAFIRGVVNGQHHVAVAGSASVDHGVVPHAVVDVDYAAVVIFPVVFIAAAAAGNADGERLVVALRHGEGAAAGDGDRGGGGLHVDLYVVISGAAVGIGNGQPDLRVAFRDRRYCGRGAGARNGHGAGMAACR